MNTNSESYKKGMKAFEFNKSLNDNPYYELDVEYDEWEKGFLFQQKKHNFLTSTTKMPEK
jgi:hypothetical protein